MQVITALFTDREHADATRDGLGDEHYSFRWLAVAKPTAVADHELGIDPGQHEIDRASDGAVGAVGRFLSGAGGSLRKALEDHGVAREDAEEIDSAAADHGAVLVVHAPDDRADEAARRLESGGGRLYRGSGRDASGGTLAATEAAMLGADAATIRDPAVATRVPASVRAGTDAETDRDPDLAPTEGYPGTTKHPAGAPTPATPTTTPGPADEPDAGGTG